MNGFVSFGKYRQSMYFMSKIFLKCKINGVHVPLFQLSYINDTTHTSLETFWLRCVVKYIICGGKIEIWSYNNGSIA